MFLFFDYLTMIKKVVGILFNFFSASNYYYSLLEINAQAGILWKFD